jgi:hypothetical protein
MKGNLKADAEDESKGKSFMWDRLSCNNIG